MSVTTWYVANAGSNSNNGTSSSTPFQTVAKVQSVAGAGDTILFNRGDRWFEELTIPAANITVDAYGATATFDSDGYGTNAPVIDGGVACAGWTSYTSGVSTYFSNDTFTGSSGTNLTSHTPNIGTGWGLQLNGGTAVAKLDGSGGVYTTTTGTVIYYMSPTLGLVNPNYFVQATVTFLTLIAGDIAGVAARCQASTKTYYAGYLKEDGTIAIQKEANGSPGNVASGTYSITSATPYTLKLTVVGNVVTFYINGVQQLTYTDPAPILGGTALFQPGDPGILISAGANAETATTGVHVSAFSCQPFDTGTATNTYQISLATQPNVVDNNGTYLFEGVGMNTLANNEFYWYNQVLYLRSDAGKPADSTVIAAQRNNAIAATSHAGVTLQNIGVEHANLQSIVISGCTGFTANKVYAQRTSYSTSAAHGVISIDGTMTNALIQYCVFRQIGGTAMYGSTTATGPITYQFNRMFDLYEQISQGIEFTNTGDTTAKVWRGNIVTIPTTQLGEYSNSEKGCVTLFGDNWLVERNINIGGALYGSTHPGNSHTVRDNFYYLCGGGYCYTSQGMNGGGGALRIADNTATAYDGSSFYRNVIVECVPAIWVDSATTANRTNMSYYNNLIVNTLVEPAVQNEAGTQAGSYQVYFNQAMSGLFENNAIYNFYSGGTGGLLFTSVVAAHTWVSDYNLWGPEVAGVFKYGGTVYATLALYSAGKSQDAHSQVAIPKFYNTYTPPAHPNLSEIFKALDAYRADWRSPARNKGVNVAGVSQFPSAADQGIEATYGTWGAAA